MIAILARRDLASAFQTPLAWLLLAAMQATLAWIMLRVLDRFTGLEPLERSAGLNLELAHNVFGSASVLLLLAAPLLAARALSQERRDGTYAMLAAMPLSPTQLLLGKFLALALLLLALCAPPLLLCLSLIGAAPVDPGLFVAAALGLWLSGLLFAAVGLFAASLTAQPALAVVIAYGLLTLLSVVNRAEQIAAEQTSLLDWLAWNQHLFWFLSGVVRISDLVYFLLMTTMFLAFAHRRLANLYFR